MEVPLVSADLRQRSLKIRDSLIVRPDPLSCASEAVGDPMNVDVNSFRPIAGPDDLFDLRSDALRALGMTLNCCKQSSSKR
jgi:hypothetical protein